MTDLQAIKTAERLFMDIPNETVSRFKKGVNSLETSRRYCTMIEIYQQGFADAIKYLKENEKCQKNLEKAKKQLQESSLFG